MELEFRDIRFPVSEVVCKEGDFNDNVDSLSGLKVWECSKDLVRYLRGRRDFGQVLELGAGHGLPGLFCLHGVAEKVTFHDYSPDVLEVTKANVQSCLERWDKKVPCAFAWGPWESLGLGDAFDLILSSEGVYKLESFPLLVAILEKHLKADGIALFAGKRYYFGCGGGTEAFVRNLPPTLEAKVVEVIEDKRSNIREIVEIRKTRVS